MTIQKVHAVLRKAGFKSSKSQATQIRGWRNLTTGYVLGRTHDGAIHVRVRTGNYDRIDRSAELATLTSYAAALVAGGIPCEVSESDPVVVTISPGAGD